MSRVKTEQQIRILRQTDLAQEVTGFLIDRRARGLTEGTVAYYADELRRWVRVGLLPAKKTGRLWFVYGGDLMPERFAED